MYIDNLPTPENLEKIPLFLHKIKGVMKSFSLKFSSYSRVAKKILLIQQKFDNLSKKELQEQCQNYKSLSMLDKLSDQEKLEAIALICACSSFVLKMKPYKVQIMAVLSLIDGNICEMATGEGKSLTAALASVFIAWKSKGCHVLSSNNYLACRDAKEFTSLYNFCHLTVGAIADDTEEDERYKCYEADITYCTNKDVAADFLRDQISLGKKQTSSRLTLRKQCSDILEDNTNYNLVLRSLEYVIVDEADSVMIDDATTPLIISSLNNDENQKKMFIQAAKIVASLDEKYYKKQKGDVELTNQGEEFCKQQKLTGISELFKRRKVEVILQALRAKHTFLKDKHYIIDDEKIVIVDQQTGRSMPDRSWQNGMHQAIEAKEKLEISPPKDVAAKISFQNFFKLYKNVCGMTGTANEAKAEFWRYYNLQVDKIPTNKPCLRKNKGTFVFDTLDAKWHKVINYVLKIHRTGQPILIGTNSVKDSEILSDLLTKKEIIHEVLNAKNHAKEAEIVAMAGNVSKVTVATNIAGRGTDIKLTKESKEVGGLCVISTQKSNSFRVDRQLYGRASRQGDPGCFCAFYSLEDDFLKKYLPFYKLSLFFFKFMPNFIKKVLFVIAEKMALFKDRKLRQEVLKNDDKLKKELSFTGEGVA